MKNNIVYKAGKNSIITLQLLPQSVTNENRKDIVNPKYAKYRTNLAMVISIQNLKSGDEMDSDVSDYDNNFFYRVGCLVTPEYFDHDTNKVCTGGIHYFKTREAAICYKSNNIAYYDNGQKVDFRFSTTGSDF